MSCVQGAETRFSDQQLLRRQNGANIQYNQRKIFPIFCDSNLSCIQNVYEGLRGLRGLEGLRSIFQVFQSSMEKIGNIASFFFFFGKTLK